MPDVKEMITTNENVQYQYSHPLWIKILGGVGLLVVAWMLFDDIRAGRNFLVVMEMLVGVSAGIWLVQVIRDDAQYIVTDRRILRQGSKYAPDMEISYLEINEVRVIRERLTGSGYVLVTALDERAIRIPIPGSGRARAEELAHTINQIRGTKLDNQLQDTDTQSQDE